jgi:hypothetical protein
MSYPREFMSYLGEFMSSPGEFMSYLGEFMSSPLWTGNLGLGTLLFGLPGPARWLVYLTLWLQEEVIGPLRIRS